MVLLYVAVPCIIGIVVGRLNIPTYWRLLNEGQATRATVDRTTCDNHGTLFYRFTVAERAYTGWGSAGFGTPACGHFKPGDPIVVYYLPSDPTVSRPGEIRDRWDNEVISVVLAVTVLPAFLTVIVWSRWPRPEAGVR